MISLNSLLHFCTQVLALNGDAGMKNTLWFSAPQECLNVIINNNTLQCSLPALYGSLYSVYVLWTVPTSSANEYRLANPTLDTVSARAPMTISMVGVATPGRLRRFPLLNGARTIPPDFSIAVPFDLLSPFFEPVQAAVSGYVLNVI